MPPLPPRSSAISDNRRRRRQLRVARHTRRGAHTRDAPSPPWARCGQYAAQGNAGRALASETRMMTTSWATPCARGCALFASAARGLEGPPSGIAQPHASSPNTSRMTSHHTPVAARYGPPEIARVRRSLMRGQMCPGSGPRPPAWPLGARRKRWRGHPPPAAGLPRAAPGGGGHGALLRARWRAAAGAQQCPHSPAGWGVGLLAPRSGAQAPVGAHRWGGVGGGGGPCRTLTADTCI